jgi:transposase
MTSRPLYHPATLLKIYLYGYLNGIQSSRRLERETQRSIELMWLTGRLMPDFKTIADFRRHNRPTIRAACIPNFTGSSQVASPRGCVAKVPRSTHKT